VFSGSKKPQIGGATLDITAQLIFRRDIYVPVYMQILCAPEHLQTVRRGFFLHRIVRLGSKADSCSAATHVRFSPKADIDNVGPFSWPWIGVHTQPE
jgi:hypothetical protein